MVDQKTVRNKPSISDYFPSKAKKYFRSKIKNTKVVFKIKILKFSHHIFVQILQYSCSLRINISGVVEVISPSPLLFARI